MPQLHPEFLSLVQEVVEYSDDRPVLIRYRLNDDEDYGEEDEKDDEPTPLQNIQALSKRNPPPKNQFHSPKLSESPYKTPPGLKQQLKYIYEERAGYGEGECPLSPWMASKDQSLLLAT